TAYLAFVNNPLHTAEPLPRVLTALRVGVYAAGLMVLPLELSADYSYNEIPIATGAGGPVEYAAVLFAALYLAVLLWSARRFPVVFFALSWSALTWLIVSNLLFPIGTIFGERLLYMPSIGFALLLAAGIARLGRLGGRWSAVAVALTVTLTGLFGARFVSRSADWSSDATLFHSAVKTSPNSAKAHSNYGWTLHVAGRYEEAIEQYGRALEIAPGLTGSGISLARTLSALGRHEEAIERYRAVLERDDGVSVAWSGLGLAQLAAGRPQEAEVSLRKALELSLGGNAEALRGLAEVMAASGRELKAGEILERLLTLSPAEPGLGEAFAEIQYRLGTRALEAGQRDEFLVRMRRAVEADASHGPAHYNLALAALESGDAAAARRHAEAGLKAGYAFPDGFLQACGIAPPAPAPGR
ncbi:MAG TPA: tetratricopeptide repeat protein, partial [Candidatus Polarisedimenticolia bacterium]|nr:tetratricopeptide repeat protein [Candidatus Polarisedimenticolia bacterium]